MKDHLSQKKTTKKTNYYIFCIFSKDVVSFSYRHGTTVVLKNKDEGLTKNTRKDDISGIIEKTISIQIKHGVERFPSQIYKRNASVINVNDT